MNDTARPAVDLYERDGPVDARGVALGLATGLLMAQHGIDAASAYGRLVQEARQQGTTVLDHAAEIARLPPVAPVLDRFQIRWLHGIDLTERELEVLRLIVEGCSNAEIGARLYVGSETVKTHTKRLFAKLGVTTRTQAAVWALRCTCSPHFVVV